MTQPTAGSIQCRRKPEPSLIVAIRQRRTARCLGRKPCGSNEDSNAEGGQPFGNPGMEVAMLEVTGGRYKRNIIRANKDQGHFTQISNVTIRNERLPAEARAVLIYLLSHSDNWRLNIKDIRRVSDWRPQSLSDHQAAY